VPKWLFKQSKVIINRCEEIGPLTKVLGGVHLIPKDAIVLIFDDDIEYQDFVVEDLVKNYKYENVICFSTDKYQPFVEAGFDFDIPGGFSGCVLHSEIVRKIQKLPQPSSCFLVDDNWLGWAYDKIGTVVKQLNDSLPYDYSSKNIYHHPKWFELRLHSNRTREQHKCLQDLKMIE
jgi:hypothetical protein